MRLPIDIPGLSTLIPEVKDGQTVIVESGADLTNSFLVRYLSRVALAAGEPVTYVTSRDPIEAREALSPNGSAGARGVPSAGGHAEGAPPAVARVVEMDTVGDLVELLPANGLLAVDSFSFLTLDLEPQTLARLLRKLHASCRQLTSTALLATDRGMFDPRSEAIAVHIADGIVQFHTREGPEGLVRYLRIPKWTDGKFFDRNVYYEFDGKRLAIDLRSRVL